MPVLDVQRRGQQIGRIRIGQQVATDKTKHDGSVIMRPDKLDTFRFTTGSKTTAKAIADLYGGEVREWERGQYEVITEKSEIGVTVPPRDQVVSQWYEMWSKGGNQRRCDSQRMQDGKPCLCPHAADPGDEDEVAQAALERSRLASLNPPQACKLVTRISVMIPDLPGLGVFRLDTGSFYAAGEIGDAAALLEMARERQIFMPAILRIEQRQRVADGKTKNYPVPVLEVIPTFRQIASGALEAAGITAQLPPAPGEPMRAIEAPAAQEPASDKCPSEMSHRTPAPPVPTDEGIGLDAQGIADIALTVAETKADIMALVENAKAARCLEDHVCTDTGNQVYEELGEVLRQRYRDLPAPEGAA